MNDDFFRYLGRHFDFNVSNGKHKSELVEILGNSPQKQVTSISKVCPFKNIVAFDGTKYLKDLGL